MSIECDRNKVMDELMARLNSNEMSVYSAVSTAYDEGFDAGDKHGYTTGLESFGGLFTPIGRLLCKLGFHKWELKSSCVYGHTNKCGRVGCKETQNFNYFW